MSILRTLRIRPQSLSPATMASAPEKKNIVIIGGGIIGCTSAYFLTRHPSYDPSKHSITLLEASEIAGGASGKAGGLLALWAYPSNIVPLSYSLHAALAKEHNGEERWGYRRLHAASVEAKGRPAVANANTSKSNGNEHGLHDEAAHVSLQKRTTATLKQAGFPADLDWISVDSAKGYQEMGTPETTAQVHPLHFTQSMATLAAEAGVKILTNARVTSINSNSSSTTAKNSNLSTVESVTYTSPSSPSSTDSIDSPTSTTSTTHTLPATHIVLAAGPWTRTLLPQAPISGLRAHSVVIRPSRPLSPYALFTSISLASTSRHGDGLRAAPEIYARPFNQVYACGEGDTLVPLPSTTQDVQVDEKRCEQIVEQVGSISEELRTGEVLARQACYLPVCSGDSGPWIGEVKGWKGLVLASGHSCWGIQNGPGTGKLVSEIVMDGKAKSAKLGALDASRLVD